MTGSAEAEERYRSVLEAEPRGSLGVEALVQLLYDESWRVRGAAAERLSRLPDGQRAVPSLLAALADRTQACARNSAAEALIRLGSAAAPAVIALMRHPDADQRRFAADILGGMRLREGTDALLGALEDADQNVRISAAEALGRIGGEPAVRELKRLLNAGDPLLRLSALQGLAELRCPPPLSQLVPLLQDVKARGSAYRLLGLVPERAAIDCICGGLAAGQRSVAEAAFAALGLQRSSADPAHQEFLQRRVTDALARMRAAGEVIERALGFADRDARAGALFAATMLRDASLATAIAEAARDDLLADDVVRALVALGPAAAELLIDRLDSLSKPARFAAAESLVQMAAGLRISALIRLAEGAEVEIQLLAIKALGQSGAVDAVEPLVRMLSDDPVAGAAAQALASLARKGDYPVFEQLEKSIASRPAASAVWALARVGKSRSLPSLRRTIRDADLRVRAASVEAAGEIGSEAAIELALIGLEDSDAAVRCAAARGLGPVSSTACGALLRRALDDSDAWVQAAAIESAGENASTELAPDLERLAASIDGLRAARAVRALARMKRLSPALWQSAVCHRDPEVIKEALLAGPSGPEGLAAAAKHLSHPRWDVRAAAARVLSTSPDSRILLSSALERESDALAREALVEALNQSCAKKNG